ncbi:MAG TPA: spermidine/putrescine ABC transporter substrate-binding protein [Opitutaceae bacterium]|nr:spermidine/putrescine ABC transporter substrate-binding protein [Opitutaceae bacterium]
MRWVLRIFFIALVVVAILFVPGTLYWRSRPVLRIYAWDGYLPPGLLNRFELANQVRIKLTTYSSNEELLARLKVSWDEFDVIMPSNYMVAQMVRYHLLERMNAESVPHIANLSLDTLNGKVVPVGDEYYGIPYLGNYAGIGYNKKLVTKPPRTWSEFFSASSATVYGPRLSLLDEPRETIGLALLAMGFSPNSRDPGELDKVRQMLQAEDRAGAPTFVLEDGRELLERRRTELLATWSPEVALAAADDADIGYIMPADGSILTYDTLAVPSSSSHQELAMKFINYLLQPEIAREVTVYSGYFNSLRRDLDPLPSGLSLTPAFAVPPAGKSFVLTDVGDAQYLYDTIWAEYRTHPEGTPTPR